MSLHDELTDFWHCAYTSPNTRQCLGTRKIKFEDDNVTSIVLKSGGDYASGSNWESESHNRCIRVPVDVSAGIDVSPYRWMFWDYDNWLS